MNDVAWLSSLLLGTVFVSAGLLKMTSPARFRDTVAATEIVGPHAATAFAYSLPLIETTIGIALVVGFLPMVARSFALGILVILTMGLLVYRLRGGRELVCGCFADFDKKVTTSSVILRNALLLVCAIPWWRSHQSSPRDVGQWLVAGTAVGGGLLAWHLAHRLTDAAAELRAGSTQAQQ